MKKLVIATGLYAPEIGGPATHTRVLEEGLGAHGFAVDVVPFSRVRKLPPVIRNIAHVFHIVAAAKGAGCIFSQDAASVGVPAYVASRLCGLPLVVRIPGDFAWEQARERFGVTDTVEQFQTKRYSFTLELMRAAQRFVVQHADAVVVTSEAFARVVRGWKPRSLTIIPNGIDPVAPAITAQLPPRPFILSASRLVRGKGFERLIALMPQLPSWTLVIAGNGPLHDALVEQAKETGVNDRVIFTGALAPAELAGWHTAADVFVLNTDYETFSFHVLESLALGTPTIATRTGAIPEFLEDGREGMLVAVGDSEALARAIQSVTQEPDLWKQRVVAGKEKAKLFSKARCVAAFAALFDPLY